MSPGRAARSSVFYRKKTGAGKEIPAPVSDYSRPQQYKDSTFLCAGKHLFLKFVVQHNKRFTF